MFRTIKVLFISDTDYDMKIDQLIINRYSNPSQKLKKFIVDSGVVVYPKYRSENTC